MYDLVRSNDTKNLKIALKNKINPNHSDRYTGTTPLLVACTYNKIQAVRMLLEAGADLNCQHYDGYNCYDSTINPYIKRLLIENSFKRDVIEGSESMYSVGFRHLSPVKLCNRKEKFKMREKGRNYRLEYKVYGFPPASGEAYINIEPNILNIQFSEIKLSVK